MAFFLDDFERYVNSRILKRGKDNYKNGCVSSVKEVAPDCYQARVWGTMVYTVNVELEDGLIDSYDCDCPYDDRPLCKHVVAVLYHLRDAQQEEDNKENLQDMLEEIIGKLTPEEMKKLISEQCAQDAKFKNSIFSRYASRVANNTPELYRQRVQAIIESFSEYGYIRYREARELARALGEIEANATEEMEKGNYRNAFYIAAALREEVMDVLTWADDSSGHISGSLSFASELLAELPEKELDEELRQEIFEYSVDAFEVQDCLGLDWDYDYAYLAIALMRTPEEKQKFRSVINGLQSGTITSEWERTSLQELAYDFICKADGEAAGMNYMLCNTENSRFRENLIDLSISAGEYDKAMQLIRSGLEHDLKHAPGLAAKWYKYELQVYLKTGDKDNIIRLAHDQFLQSRGWNSGVEHYRLLKKYVPADGWNEYVDQLIGEIQTRYKSDYGLLTTVYIQEKRWESFLQQVYNWPSFERIAHAEKYMAAIYPIPLAEMYGECILADMQSTSDRSRYQQTCSYLRRMINLGAEEQARKIGEELKKLYPRRKAMIEEINEVFKNFTLNK